MRFAIHDEEAVNRPVLNSPKIQVGARLFEGSFWHPSCLSYLG